MNSSEKDYNRLYKLQDKVFAVIAGNYDKFYLTGGTALCRFYLDHRYSDDIDLFVNKDREFKTMVEIIRHILDSHFKPGPSPFIFYDEFVRLFVTDGQCELKIEFVNDVEARYGQTLYAEGIPVDNPANILSNKLGAIIGRDESKDVFDIISLAENYSFNWNKIFEQTLRKVGVTEQDVTIRLATFPVEWFDDQQWLMKPVDKNDLRNKLEIIADDFLFARDNSLGKGKEHILDAKPKPFQ